MQSSDLREAPKTLTRIGKVKPIFIITLKCYFPFELPFSHGYTAEFSRGYIMYAIPRNWIQEIEESSCLPPAHTLKGFAKKSKIMPIFSLSFPFLFEICAISFLFLQNKSPKSWWLKKKNIQIHFSSYSFCSPSMV